MPLSGASIALPAPEDVVFPGHPLVLAMFIMREYSSLAEAIAFSGESWFCAALDNSNIPGIGEQTCHALRVLEDLTEVSGIPAAMRQADALWRKDSRLSPEALDAGSRQAQVYERAFMQKVTPWRSLAAEAMAA